MDKGNLSELLIEGVKHFGYLLNEVQLGKLLQYKELLVEWNEKVNLTAIEEDKDIIIKHYIDSLSILPYLEDADIKLIDIGTGGGFPGVPVKIAYPRIDVTLLDSLDKRLKVLNEVISVLGLMKIKTVHGRAEDFGVNPEFREKYDVAVARAVANLPVLLEYCLPFVKVGGKFIAMKGSNVDEVEMSKKSIGDPWGADYGSKGAYFAF